MLKGKIVGANKRATMGADEVGDMALLTSFTVCVAVCISPKATLSKSNNNIFFAL